VLVVLALLRILLGDFFASLTSAPYWNVIQIVIGGVVAILILLFLWRLAECAGLFGRVGMVDKIVAFSGLVAFHPRQP
jgi:hypothetical protein